MLKAQDKMKIWMLFWILFKLYFSKGALWLNSLYIFKDRAKKYNTMKTFRNI